jgi:amidase
MLAKRDFIKGLLAYAGSVPVASAFARDGSDAALCYASVSELIAAFKAGRLSPVELLQAQIKRIEEYNPVINAITYKHFGQAIADAKASEERYKKGTERPLEGITVAIKDENDRVGWRTTMGSLVYKDAPFAKENSPIIDALEATGAVLHIQTTVPEFYLSVSASTYAWGTTRNVEPGIFPRRILERLRRGLGRGVRNACDGLRYGRFNPATGVAVPALWLQAALRTGRDVRHLV